MYMNKLSVQDLKLIQLFKLIQFHHPALTPPALAADHFNRKWYVSANTWEASGEGRGGSDTTVITMVVNNTGIYVILIML